MKHKKTHRQWLNEWREGGRASIMWEIEYGGEVQQPDRWAKGWSLHIHSDLTISDCNRVVDLTFPFNPEEQAHSFRKLDRLIDSLKAFKAAAQAAIKNRERMIAEAKKNHKPI